MEVLIKHVKDNGLPVHINRGIPYMDENDNEVEHVIAEYPDTGFDFNRVMNTAINMYISNFILLYSFTGLE